MISRIIVSLAAGLVLCLLQTSCVDSFAPNAVRSATSTNRVSFSSQAPSQHSSRLHLFGPAKDDGKPGDYVCKDCGYVFTKGPAAWAKLDDRTYQCPPCGAPKFRFKKVPKGSASGKVEVKKSWF